MSQLQEIAVLRKRLMGVQVALANEQSMRRAADELLAQWAAKPPATYEPPPLEELEGLASHD